MPGNSSQPWGLILPGRAPTPSEGAAQTYQRVGPHGTQKTRTFDNGTCLTFGPHDLVDEFNLYKHPFSDQIVLIDNAIRDCRAERIRYESIGMASFREEKGEVVFLKDDPFNSFRTTQIPFDPNSAPVVHISSGTYIQVPSVYAHCSDLRSVYSTQNKADTKGDSHWSYGSDSRFGVTGKPAEGFSQRNRPKTVEGGPVPAFKHNGEKTYSKTDSDSKDDRTTNEKNRPRPPRHVRNEAERHRIEKEKQAEAVFEKKMQNYHGSMRRSGRANSKMRPAEFAHAYHGYKDDGLKHPIPLKNRPADPLFIEQLHMQQSGGRPASAGDEDSLLQRLVEPGRFGQINSRHEQLLRAGGIFELPGMDKGRHSSNSRIIVSQGVFESDHGRVKGYPPGFGPPPPLSTLMNTQVQAGMHGAVAELEASVPNNSMSAGPPPRLGRQRSSRGRDQARMDQDMIDQEYAKMLDEQNAISRQRGDAIMGGDAMSGEAIAMRRYNIPVDFQVHPPTPRRNNMNSMTPNDMDVRRAVAGNLQNTMGSYHEPLYHADRQSTLMTPNELRAAVARNLPGAMGPNPQGSVSFAHSEPVSPKLVAMHDTRRVASQSGPFQESQSILAPVRRVETGIMTLPLGLRENPRPHLTSRQVSTPNPTDGSGTGRRMSISNPGTPRVGWNRLIREMPRNRVQSPATRVATLNQALPTLDIPSDTQQTVGEDHMKKSTKESNNTMQTPKWLGSFGASQS